MARPTHVRTSSLQRALRDSKSGTRGASEIFFFSSRRRHTRSLCDWSSDVCSSDLRARPLTSPQPDGPMAHGTQSYFSERARNARRLSLIAAVTGLAVFSALGLSRLPPFKRVVDVINDPMRFGFEGPEQYVRRITLTRPPGEAQTLRDLGAVRERSATRGGAPTPVE